MERRKIIIYAISAIVFVYGIYFHFFSGEGLFGAKKTPPPTQQSAVPEVVAPPVLAAAPAIPSISKPANEVEFKDKWSRDPFRHDRQSAPMPLSTNTVAREEYPPPRISAISNMGGERMAIVDGKLLQIGGMSGVWRLIQIVDDKALFAGPDGRVWVKLGG